MWKSVVNDQIDKDLICDKIDDIYSALLKRVDKSSRFDLYMGESGICLFFTYYQIVNNLSLVNVDDLVSEIVDEAIKCDISNCKELTFYAEIAWFLCYLYKQNQIDIDVNEYFLDIDESLYKGMIMLLNKNEYGCINGAISVGLYFYYRYILGNKKSKRYLESFVDALKEIAIEKEETIEWISIIDYGTRESGYNIGIAHGIPGVLLFLRKLYIEGIRKDIISNIIIKSSNFLLSQQRSLKTNRSYFYNVCSGVPASGHDTRLGWCYGDMSVGYSLFMVSSLNGIERENVKSIALKVLMDTISRTNLLDIGIVDAGLCHGTAGIAHIYNRLYHQTNESKFKDAALFWYRETLKMVKKNNRYAGYELPYYLTESEKELSDLHNFSFLTGIAGTGLSLLSAVHSVEPSWDLCLLLS